MKSISPEDEKLLEKTFIDGNRFCQVIINLLSNAAKFSPQGSSVKVGINVLRHEPTDEQDDLADVIACIGLCPSFAHDKLRPHRTMLEVKITDCGAGIPEHLLDRLFCDFGNLEIHKKENPEGRGLGLSICKLIAEQMRGKIEV